MTAVQGQDRSSAACVMPAPTALGTQPAMQIWHKGEAPPAWRGPGCAAWASGDYSAVVTLSGDFAFDGSADDLLLRFGRISSLVGIRYWSVGDNDWRTLITNAAALTGAKSMQHRADFSIDEMRHDNTFYYSQSDSRSSTAVTYRMRVLAADPDRVVIEMENVSSVKLLFVPIYGAGDLKSVISISRVGNGVWRYDGLSAIREGSISFGGNHDPSYVNRAVALYRHIAGIPTDRDPPLAR
jgi:hypothetical protein